MAIFEKLWEMLDKYTFDIEPQSLIHVTCIMCHGLLKDAYEGLCGCSYCWKCVDQYLEKGGEYCPNDECKSEYISLQGNVVKSNSTNRKISKLLVKCPSDVCNHQSELIKMCDHLKTCDKLLIHCPYSEIGCSQLPMQIEQVKRHLVSNLDDHNKSLIVWILNMKNDMTSVVLNRQTLTENELNNLVQTMDMKISQRLVNYNSNEDFVRTLQQEIRDLKQINGELSLLVEDMKLNYDKQISQLKLQIDNQEKQNQMLKENLKLELDTLQIELRNQIELSKNLPNNFGTMQLSPSIDPKAPIPVVEDRLTKIASFIWNISDISRIVKAPKSKVKSATIPSEYFYSINKEFQMWLNLYPSGFGDGTHMSVEFRIKNGGKTKSNWPFKGIVTILVKNKTNPDSQQIISKQCDIDEPVYYFGSEFFHFLYADLEISKVFLHNAISIQCIVDMNK